MSRKLLSRFSLPRNQFSSFKRYNSSSSYRPSLDKPTHRITIAGAGLLSVSCNIAYAAARAKNDPNDKTKRIATFIFGFPYTILPWMIVDEGKGSVYGTHFDK